MKTKFGKRIQQFFENIKQIKIDKDNRKQFLIDIEREMADPKSKFNEYRLSMNDDKTAITTIVSIPENFQLAGSYTQVGNIKLSDGTYNVKGKNLTTVLADILDFAIGVVASRTIDLPVGVE